MNRMYWITGILGVLLIVAPFVLVFNGNLVATWTSVILGAAIVVVSAIKGLLHDATPWEYWVAGILGILAIVSPFVLRFSALPSALYTTIVLGLIVLLAAAYQLMGTRTHAH
ncbi:MAG: SPW repeat protein [Chloroflexi bacterium]|nr:SPW repeat protein [Chloroflexota bacterium]